MAGNDASEVVGDPWQLVERNLQGRRVFQLVRQQIGDALHLGRHRRLQLLAKQPIGLPGDEGAGGKRAAQRQHDDAAVQGSAATGGAQPRQGSQCEHGQRADGSGDRVPEAVGHGLAGGGQRRAGGAHAQAADDNSGGIANGDLDLRPGIGVVARETMCRGGLPLVGGQRLAELPGVVGEDDTGGVRLDAEHRDGGDCRVGCLQVLDHRFQPEHLARLQSAHRAGAQGGFEVAGLDLDARQHQLVEQTAVLVEQHVAEQRQRQTLCGDNKERQPSPGYVRLVGWGGIGWSTQGGYSACTA